MNSETFRSSPFCKTSTNKNFSSSVTTPLPLFSCLIIVWVDLILSALNSNNFTGSIPPSLGRLSKLYWLDLAENQLTGTLPVSTNTSPGLDLLHNAKHLWASLFFCKKVPYKYFSTNTEVYVIFVSHLNKNQLSGSIPEKLFNAEMILIHM